jgi:hypothetical protein
MCHMTRLTAESCAIFILTTLLVVINAAAWAGLVLQVSQHNFKMPENVYE